jgi:hypothetical protein
MPFLCPQLFALPSVDLFLEQVLSAKSSNASLSAQLAQLQGISDTNQNLAQR